MFEEAESEALRALGVFEKLGATNDVEKIDGRSIKQTWIQPYLVQSEMEEGDVVQQCTRVADFVVTQKK